MRRSLLTAVLLALVALLSACGGSDEQGGPSTAPRPEQAPVALTGGSTTLAIDIQTAGVLADNGIEIAAVAPAREVSSGVRDTRLRFPISGGAARPDTLAGRIQNGGGLSISDGRNRVVFRDIVVNTVTGQLTADAGAGRIALLNLAVGRGRLSEQDGAVVLADVPAVLDAIAARALTDVLATAVLRPDQVIGSLTIRIER